MFTPEKSDIIKKLLDLSKPLTYDVIEDGEEFIVKYPPQPFSDTPLNLQTAMRECDAFRIDFEHREITLYLFLPEELDVLDF